jgi:carbonic anhydrase/acetyltransferase-like protein (isoleucine patch superfamily)
VDDTTSTSGPPAPTGADDLGDGLTVAGSARVLGRLWAAPRTYLAQGAIIRSLDGVELGHDSAVLETCVVIGTSTAPVRIGRKTVFGHRCTVIGATVGDLCEVGNASVLLPGSSVGTGCFLGERTLVAAGQRIPPGSVVVGQPARVIRAADEADQRRLLGLRAGDLRLHEAQLGSHTGRIGSMGSVYAYRGIEPAIDGSAVLFDSAEITGDVVIGPDTIIGAGVKIIGDSHGPVRIGARVQILENAVLHLLPDNDLLIGDDVIIGPNAMIHGCHIGAGTVVEPAATVCDNAIVGRECLVGAGSVVKQRSQMDDRSIIDGFPAVVVGRLEGPPPRPAWRLDRGDLPRLLER